MSSASPNDPSSPRARRAQAVRRFAGRGPRGGKPSAGLPAPVEPKGGGGGLNGGAAAALTFEG